MLRETKELIALLPYNMRERSRGYMDFVNDTLYSVALEEGVYDRRGEVQYEVEMVFMLKLLYAYFVTGYQNFTQVLEFLEHRGADGFEIGSSSYRRNSDVTHDWERVVSELIGIAHGIEGTDQMGFLTRYVMGYGSTEAIVRDIVQNAFGINGAHDNEKI